MRFIVAEISKNWAEDEPYIPGTPTINVLFEQIINTNHERGYRLHSFTLHRLMVNKSDMNETIIAVFERKDP